MASPDLSALREEIISQMKRKKVLHNSIKDILQAGGKRTIILRAEESLIQKDIEKRLDAYSKTACRQLCEKIIGKLPRELRDLISEFLITPDDIYAGVQYLNNEGMPCENDRGAHFWDKEYVGETMSIEFIENWYRLSLFYFWDKTRNAEIVDRFMALDRWGCGIKPNEHISRVRFDLGDSTLHNGFDCRDDQVKANCDQEAYSSHLASPLKTLSRFRMPNRVRFLIRIHTLGSLVYRCLEGERLRETLDELLVELKELRSVGHRFTVQWSELGDLEFTSYGTLATDAWNKDLEEAIQGIPRRR